MEYIDIHKLKNYERNPRKVNDKEFKDLKKSIQDHPEFFEARPVLYNKDFVVFAGNMRLRAARELGMEKVPSLLVDVSKEEQDKIMLLDNRQAGKWDFEILGADFDITELLGVGFSEMELGLAVANDPNAEWADMPEFHQADKTAMRSIIVNFKTKEDVDDFAERIGQELSEKIRSIWHPEVRPEKSIDKIYTEK